MKVYKTRISKLSGSDYKEVNKKAFGLYNEIRRKTKRRPYVRLTSPHSLDSKLAVRCDLFRPLKYLNLEPW